MVVFEGRSLPRKSEKKIGEIRKIIAYEGPGGRQREVSGSPHSQVGRVAGSRNPVTERHQLPALLCAQDLLEPSPTLSPPRTLSPSPLVPPQVPTSDRALLLSRTHTFR